MDIDMQVQAIGGICYAQGYDLRIDRAIFSRRNERNVFSFSVSRRISKQCITV